MANLKSRKAHEREGTYRKSRHGHRKPVHAPGTLTQPPDFLTPSQQRAWTRVMQVAPDGVLAACDYGAVLVYVVAEARLVEALDAQAKLGKNPLLYETKNGNVIQSPFLGVINRASAMVLKAAAELGFTPSARLRMEATALSDEEAEVNQFQKLIDSRPPPPKPN